MVSTWMGDHSCVEVDAVVNNMYCKIPEAENGASEPYSWGEKRKESTAQ